MKRRKKKKKAMTKKKHAHRKQMKRKIKINDLQTKISKKTTTQITFIHTDHLVVYETLLINYTLIN